MFERHFKRISGLDHVITQGQFEDLWSYVEGSGYLLKAFQQSSDMIRINRINLLVNYKMN